MLLSDRDIKAEVAADRVQIDPYDEGMIQPSSTSRLPRRPEADIWGVCGGGALDFW